ncbi:MAG: acyltransferase domain-containing protein, partial [Bacteroidales bacterium]|nr:acyltransferase domain-containing protein [Bacteroidales bacterium]
MKRTINTRLPLIVSGPPKVFDISYFDAIYQAGALPLLDTEYFSEKENIENINKIINKGILFGLRMLVTDKNLTEFLEGNNFKNLDLIVFSYKDKEELKGFIFKNRYYKYFIEIKDIGLDENRLAGFGIEANGLILKGYEAGGRVSKYTSFILMQWYLEHCELPVFINGGVGMHTGAGLFAAGCSGVVLTDQLYLTEESPLSKDYKQFISKIDEKDTAVIGDSIENRYRFFARLGTKVVNELKEKENEIFVNSSQPGDHSKQLQGIVEFEKIIGLRMASIDKPTSSPQQELFFMGQDAMFARHFVKKSKKLKDVIYNFFISIGENLALVEENDPLTEGSLLAEEHKTIYPVIQGPMGNITDNADFAEAVFKAGALPFFAMGNLPESVAENILRSGAEKLEIFGAGLIGAENYNEPVIRHFDLIKKYKVKYSILAGGNPSQVNDLEAAGIKTYLHTPALQILENALNNSMSHRFIFEGTEAGGHVGNLSSLALWELAIERLLNQLQELINKQYLIFAGGISSKPGSAFISGLTSNIASKGAKIGISVATSYLFTKEIVQTKAMSQLYQDIIKERDETVVIASSIGLPTRTTLTPYSETILKNEQKWIKDRTDLQIRKKNFETFNLGSLLIAAKAFAPDFVNNPDKFIYYEADEHFRKGNFITGDSLIFYNDCVTIEAVHNCLFKSKHYLFDNINRVELLTSENSELNDEIAVIGIAGIYPDAANVEEFWQNILAKKYSIIEIPKERFDSELYYDKDHKAEDKSYSHIAGVVKDFEFDYKRFGYTKEEAKYIGRSQKMILQTAMDAVKDAGYDRDKSLPKSRTGVVIGDCLGSEFIERHHKYFFPEIKYYLEQLEEFNKLKSGEKEALLNSIKQEIEKDYLDDKLENILVSVNSARIAKHLKIEGSNYTVDAACATSFIAIDCAIKSLLSYENDCMIAGGISANLAPELFVGFCKMNGLSDDGSFPFDVRSNGFVMGEGAGVLLLKRMKDAIRDKDKIHAIIKAVGASSDGKGKAIAAPNSDGQGYALKRCFEKIKTAISFDDIDYIEAHGTSTLAGDAAEIHTIKTVYKTSHPIGISSVKSQIGHLLSGAGAAGITKVIFAIKNKTLPPNGQFKNLSENIKLESPFYIIEEAAEWKSAEGRSRKAAVSSFGFGGINTHIIVEEYTAGYKRLKRNIFANPDYDFNDNRIVVAGAGCLLPDATNTAQFWANLESGKVSLYDIPEERFHNDYYSKETDPRFNIPKIKAGIIRNFKFNSIKYKLPPATIKLIDKHQLYAIEAAAQAIEQSGIQSQLIKGNRVGVIMGNTMSGENFYEIGARIRLYAVIRAIKNTGLLAGETKGIIAEKLGLAVRKRFPKSTEDTFPGYITNLISGRIANIFNCNGSNFAVDSASASSAQSISLAIRGLKNKDFDFVITGGVDSNMTPSVNKGLQSWGLLSKGENKPFSKEGGGINPAEGAVVFVLTTLKQAKEKNLNIIAEIKDIKISSSSSAQMLTSPDKAAYIKSISELYKENALRVGELNYLELYAAGISLFDLLELQCVNKVFSNKIYSGSLKANIGYLKSAHPAAVMLKLILMSEKHKILANHLKQDNLIINQESSLLINDQPIQLAENTNRVFAANFFGIGGNHGHFLINSLPHFLDKNIKINAIPIAVEQTTKIKEEKCLSLCVLLSGQGSQYEGMMKELYNSEEIIRRVLDDGEKIYSQAKGSSILQVLFEDGNKLKRTEFTQPAIFLSSAAIYELLKVKGIKQSNFIGHSLGEFSALYCSGMLDFEVAFKLVMKRAELMQQAADNNPGTMLAVFRNAEESDKLIKASAIANIYLANKNCDEQTVISGSNDGIAAFTVYLQQLNKEQSSLISLTGRVEQIIFSPVNVSTAFHTPYFSKASEALYEYLKGVEFNNVNYGRVYSNVTGLPYPQDVNEIKRLLAIQMLSPVEFVLTLNNAEKAGISEYIEVGPNRMLSNMLKRNSIKPKINLFAIDPKSGENKSIAKLISDMEINNLLETRKIFVKDTLDSSLLSKALDRAETPKMNEAPNQFNMPKADLTLQGKEAEGSLSTEEPDFSSFLTERKDEINKIIAEQYNRYKKEKEQSKQDKYGLFTGNIVISGVSIGLPGSGYRVFDNENFNRLLNGMNLIEALSNVEKEKIFDKHITRLNKTADGAAQFQDIKNTDEVIQLAAKLGYFDLKKEYGIDYTYDITYSLGIAAGIESLKDANIPLVMNYKTTSTGARLAEGFALPEEMQETTGVIFSSVFRGYETIIDEITKYYKDKFINRPLNEFEKIYFYLMENVKDIDIKRSITEWYNNIKYQSKNSEPYQFNRKLLLDIASLGSTHFAQIIKAKGPNTQISATCTSTTQAICVAEDWIRTGRCDRVIIIGGEAATSDIQHEWIGSSFLSIGAATDKRIITDAAIPFDERRSGLVLGSAAVSLIIEKEEEVKKRGLNGQAQVLGTYLGNSAFHASKIDTDFFTAKLDLFFKKIEKFYGIKREDIANKLLLMSHESYTPGQGGPATAEAVVLKKIFPEYYKEIVISNIKGYTGSTLGAAIEDAVMVKALQKGKAPVIANLKQVPDEFRDLRFSDGNHYDFDFAMHLAAGFGSYFSFLLIRKLQENTVENNQLYQAWLKNISGQQMPELKIINNTLCVPPVINQNNEQKAISIEKEPAVKSPQPVAQSSQPAKVQSPQPTVNRDFIAAEVKSIIAGQTGYELDMLEEALDLEADLGIDTVKQVEIFGKITAKFSLQVPENLKLSKYNTIEKIIGFVLESSGNSLQPATVQSPQPVRVQSPQSAVSRDFIAAEVKSIIAGQTGYELEMLEEALDLEADLGIDTVKQVEIFGKITTKFSLQVPENLKLSKYNTIEKIIGFVLESSGNSPQPAVQSPQPAVSRDFIAAEVKSIIAGQTGYELDMLEEGLDLEADLGIDTVKQVEIFGKITAKFSLQVPENLKLSKYNTIEKIIGFVLESSGNIPQPAVQSPQHSVQSSQSPESNKQPAMSSTIVCSDEEAKKFIRQEQAKVPPLINNNQKLNGNIIKETRSIISEQTGCATDMLDVSLDLLADLGIDTVK